MENVSLVLPQKAVALIGHEFNMYYANIIQCADLNAYYVGCSISPNPERKIFNKSNTWVFSDCFRTTPPEGSEGEYTLSVSLRDKVTGQTVASGSLALHVLADRIDEPRRVLFLGDSLTEAGIVAAEIQHRLSGGKLTTLGTRQRTVKLDGVDYTALHEGRSSWSAYDYTSPEVERFRSEVNVFYNPDTDKFDFAYYMKKQGYDGVDVVCINLGTNGAWLADKTCAAMDEIIASIHAYDKNIKIIVALIAIGSTQDGFAFSTGLDSAGGFRMSAIALIKRYLEKYDGTSDNVFVSETYFCLDEVNDYDAVTTPLSARNPGTRVIPSNNVHPNVYGYLKFADVCYNNILYALGH